VSRVPLSDEERRVVLAGQAGEDLRELDAGQQEQVLRRLLDVVEADAKPSAFVREQIGDLDIIAAGDTPRLYAKIVEDVPRGNATYHVVFVLYIDYTHDYPQTALHTYSDEAAALLDETTDLEEVEDLEAFLDDLGALDADALRRLLP
jgi:hypothetical protein